MSPEIIKQHIVDFCNVIGMPFLSITVRDGADSITANIVPKDNASLYIGYRGQNLAAMQHLMRIILWDAGMVSDKIFILDIDGYQEKNNERIFEILDQKIELVKKNNEPQLMPFLQPLERRMVHLKIKTDYPSFESESFNNAKGERVLKIIKK